MLSNFKRKVKSFCKTMTIATFLLLLLFNEMMIWPLFTPKFSYLHILLRHIHYFLLWFYAKSMPMMGMGNLHINRLKSSQTTHHTKVNNSTGRIKCVCVCVLRLLFLVSKALCNLIHQKEWKTFPTSSLLCGILFSLWSIWNVKADIFVQYF